MKGKQKRRTEKHGWFVGIVIMTVIIVDTQSCGVRKVMSNRKVPTVIMKSWCHADNFVGKE